MAGGAVTVDSAGGAVVSVVTSWCNTAGAGRLSEAARGASPAQTAQDHAAQTATCSAKMGDVFKRSCDPHGRAFR